MKKILFLLAVLFCQITYAQEPLNLALLKQQLISYHDSGEYAKDIRQVVNDAREYLKQRIQQNAKSPAPKKLAIVLDIDETSVSNYGLMLKNDFSSDSETVWRELSQPNASLIPSTYDLYQLAKKNKVAVFFVTGRGQSLRDSTVKNLCKVGYDGWAKLYLRPDVYKQKSVSVFKTAMRKQIAQQGYQIVLNMGDQMSDLRGGYADRTYKLPDPYYYVP